MELRQVEMFIRRTGHPERRMLLPRGEVVLGRAEDADVVLSDVGVSRRHARVTVSADGVRVEDLGSGNGTYMGARKLAQATSLKEGDEVRIDPFTLSFRLTYEGARPALAPLSLPAVARLEVISAHAIGKGSFPLPAEGVLSLGRAENNDIVLPEPSSSRNHAEVHGSGGRWYVRDRGSSNGTLVNDVAVAERVLQEGDRIRIGAIEFRFTQTLASVDADFGDRTENFDGVLDVSADDGPPVRPVAPGANVPTRLSTSPTLLGPPPAAPPTIEGTRTLPPGELPREMPFSRRTESLPPTPSPERERPAAAAPPPPPRARPEVYTAPPERPRSFLANPVNQISLGVVFFAMCLVGAWVMKELAEVVMARVSPEPAVAAAAARPGLAEPPAPAPSAAPAVVEPSAPVAAAPAEPSAPAEPAAAPSADPPVASAAPAATPPPAPPSAVSPPAPAGVASAGLSAPTVASPRMARPAGAPAPTSDAEKLVADGRAMLDEGRLFDAAASFFRAVQVEPTNTSAEHWGYAACELIAVEHMRASMRGVAPPAEPPPRTR